MRRTQRNSLTKLAALVLGLFLVTSPPFLSAKLERPLCLALSSFPGKSQSQELTTCILANGCFFLSLVSLSWL